MSGGSLSGTPAPLTEAQHSNVVELASALEEFLSADNDGVPAQVLVDGEQRLRRLLNLWFTPTVEVVREYRRQVEAIVSGGGGARIAGSGGPGRVVRPSHGGGVGPLDLLQLLAQRGADGDAAAEVEAQVSAAAALEAQAVLGLPLGEIVVASFVCREHTTTLGGRLFVTQTRVGFSPCGVGPDHPHDAHGATVAKIEHVTRAWTSEGSGTAAAALHVSLVEGVTIRFECFVGGARAREIWRWRACERPLPRIDRTRRSSRTRRRSRRRRRARRCFTAKPRVAWFRARAKRSSSNRERRW